MLNRFRTTNLLLSFLVVASLLFTTSCSDDDAVLGTQDFKYSFHNGQTVPTAPYTGTHPSNFSATLSLEELENGNTNVTVTLENTIDGMTYHTHAHDAADATTTPNGTPYDESPNGGLFVSAIEGNGGTVSASQETTMSFTDITTNYSGFFVVHDPLQDVNTADITTYLVVGGFAREQAAAPANSTTFSYDFNTGQLVADFAYSGPHPTTLGATITVEELAGNQSRVVVNLSNTMDGMTYHTHAHDMADPETTPNNTPYNEMPNADVFAAPIAGNGGTAGVAKISTKSYEELTTSYDGFFVVHDPLQDLTTSDPTTYVVLGVFAR